MKKYIKRATMAEAIRIPECPDESTVEEIKEWVISKGDRLKSSNVALIRGRTVSVFTIQGNITLNPGDFLVRGEDGIWRGLGPSQFMTEYDESPEVDKKRTAPNDLDENLLRAVKRPETWIKAFVYYHGEFANSRMVEKWADDRWPNPYRAAEMSQYFTSPEIAFKWHNRATNIDAKTLNSWAGVFDINEIPVSWCLGKWKPHEAKKWIDAGWVESTVAKRWSEYVDDPKLAFVLHECGLRLPRHLTRKPDNA